MSIARVIEISAASASSFDAPIAKGVACAGDALRIVPSAWAKE